VFRYNLLFFVSGGGKFNYQGTKRWLEDNLDHTGMQAELHPYLYMMRLNYPPHTRSPTILSNKVD
jgi:hypothetical protein